MKSLLYTTTTLLFIAFFNPVVAQYNLVGTWQSTEVGDSSLFIFDKEGYATIVSEGVPMGGKSYGIEGLDIPACVKYKAAIKGKTCTVNLYVVLLDADSSILLVGPGLIEFTDTNTIKFALNMEHDEEGDVPAATLEKLRPKDFSNPDETIVLKRVIKK